MQPCSSDSEIETPSISQRYQKQNLPPLTPHLNVYYELSSSFSLVSTNVVNKNIVWGRDLKLEQGAVLCPFSNDVKQVIVAGGVHVVRFADRLALYTDGGNNVVDINGSYAHIETISPNMFLAIVADSDSQASPSSPSSTASVPLQVHLYDTIGNCLFQKKESFPNSRTSILSLSMEIPRTDAPNYKVVSSYYASTPGLVATACVSSPTALMVLHVVVTHYNQTYHRARSKSRPFKPLQVPKDQHVAKCELETFSNDLHSGLIYCSELPFNGSVFTIVGVAQECPVSVGMPGSPTASVSSLSSVNSPEADADTDRFIKLLIHDKHQKNVLSYVFNIKTLEPSRSQSKQLVDTTTMQLEAGRFRILKSGTESALMYNKADNSFIDFIKNKRYSFSDKPCSSTLVNSAALVIFHPYFNMNKCTLAAILPNGTASINLLIETGIPFRPANFPMTSDWLKNGSVALPVENLLRDPAEQQRSLIGPPSLIYQKNTTPTTESQVQRQHDSSTNVVSGNVVDARTFVASGMGVVPNSITPPPMPTSAPTVIPMSVPVSMPRPTLTYVNPPPATTSSTSVTAPSYVQATVSEPVQPAAAPSSSTTVAVAEAMAQLQNASPNKVASPNPMAKPTVTIHAKSPVAGETHKQSSLEPSVSISIKPRTKRPPAEQTSTPTPTVSIMPSSGSGTLPQYVAERIEKSIQKEMRDSMRHFLAITGHPGFGDREIVDKIQQLSMRMDEVDRRVEEVLKKTLGAKSERLPKAEMETVSAMKDLLSTEFHYDCRSNFLVLQPKDRPSSGQQSTLHTLDEIYAMMPREPMDSIIPVLPPRIKSNSLLVKYIHSLVSHEIAIITAKMLHTFEREFAARINTKINEMLENLETRMTNTVRARPTGQARESKLQGNASPTRNDSLEELVARIDACEKQICQLMGKHTASPEQRNQNRSIQQSKQHSPSQHVHHNTVHKGQPASATQHAQQLSKVQQKVTLGSSTYQSSAIIPVHPAQVPSQPLAYGSAGTTPLAHHTPLYAPSGTLNTSQCVPNIAPGGGGIPRPKIQMSLDKPKFGQRTVNF